MKSIRYRKRPIVYIIGQYTEKTRYGSNKKKSIIYKSIERGPVKIGYTDRPEHRLAELQTGNPRFLLFIAQLDVLDSVIGKAIEKELHAILRFNKSINKSKKDKLGFYSGTGTEWFNISFKLAISILSSFPFIKESIVKKIPNDYHSKLPITQKNINIISNIDNTENARAADGKFNVVTIDSLRPSDLLHSIFYGSHPEITKNDFRFRNFTAIEPYK